MLTIAGLVVVSVATLYAPLAYEKQIGRRADRRQHVRFRQVASADDGSLRLGPVTFDAGVGSAAIRVR